MNKNEQRQIYFDPELCTCDFFVICWILMHIYGIHRKWYKKYSPKKKNVYPEILSLNEKHEFDLFVLMLFEGHLSYSGWSVIVCALTWSFSQKLLGQCNLHQIWYREIVNSTPPPPLPPHQGDILLE